MPSSNMTRGLLNTLGARIVRGDYDVGDVLPSEADIAQGHKVSRTVTREAMKMLAAKGLVKAWPRRGTIVQDERDWNLMDPDVMKWLLDRGVSLKLVKDFLNMRLAIEPAAAEMAAIKGEDLSEIEEALSKMTQAANGIGDALSADCMFHASILKASGNRFFEQMAPLVDTALRMTIRVTNQIKGVQMASIEDHENILNAIRGGQSKRARDLIHTHICAALDLVEATYPNDVNLKL